MPSSPSRLPRAIAFICVTVSFLLAAGCQSASNGLSSPPAGSDETKDLRVSSATVPSLFTETRIAETFKQATQMVIAPDGRIFVAEQPGVVRIVKNDVLLSTPFATIPAADIEAGGSRGLMGIALSPSFSTDRYVYLAYTRKSPLNNRIIRIRASATNPDVAETTSGAPTVSVAFDLSPQGSSSAHNSMAMRFSGGLLYVSTGDNGTPTNAQNVDHSAGKILRMNPDLTPASGNPYGTVTSANNWKKRLWGKGLRNPWTMAVHPTSGLLYVSDVGSFEGTGGTPNADGVPREEINNIVTASPRASELDYGWPNTEGAGANIIHAYRNAPGEDVVPSDCAVVGGTFYQPNASAFPGTPKFPSSYNGAYFFGDHCAGTIKYLPAAQQTPQTLTGNPPANSARSPITFATQVIVGLVQIEAHPDGSLYYLTRAIVRPRDPNVNGILIKVSYSGSAVPETCALTAPANGSRLTAPANVTLTADAADATVGIQKVEFLSTNSNVPGATQVKLGEDASAPYSFTATDLEQNAYRLVARCTNLQGGFKDSDPITVTVNGPTGTIDNPVSSFTYNAGETINFSGSAFDIEDGSIPASRFLWIIELGHGVGEGAHFHESERFEGVTGGSFVVSRNEELDPNVFQRINLQVQDSAGIYHTAERDIFPNKTTATVTTSPAGLTVKIDGTDRVGPASFLSVVGMERALSAPATQSLNGRMYQFVSWSNAGAPTHLWLVPAGNPTITATYQDIGAAWLSQDIGAVGAAGSFTDGGATLTVRGAGADIYGAADEGHFAYRTVTGDVTIVARVATLQNTNTWTKAGVMIRDGLAAGARNVFALTSPTPTNKFRLQSRTATGGSTTSAASVANSVVPSYLRLVRTGGSFTAAHATAATGPWTTIGTVNVTMAATVQVGLAVTSHVDATVAAATFDNVAISLPAPPPAPATLNASPGNNQISLVWAASAGATSYSVKRSLTDGGPYTAVVTGHTSTSYTNTGLTNGTRYYYVVTASNSAGESPSSPQASAIPQLPPPPPVPGGLTASGANTQVNLTWSASAGATGYNVKRASDTGGPYTTIAANHQGTSYSNTGLTNGVTYYYVVSAVGPGGESGNSGEAPGTPSAPVVSWSSLTIGTSTQGTWSESAGTHTIEGSGADIQGTADGFHFVYRNITGNATITARVASLENTANFVKAGVMVREGTTPGARNMLVLTTATATNGNRIQYRPTANGATTAVAKATGQPNSVIPGWLRIVRNANNLSGYYSANGTTWTQLGTTQSFASLPSILQIGLAVTSHVDGTLATGVFNSVTISSP